MHTAMRLALSACAAIRGRRADLPLCLYGLYAGLDAGRDETSTGNLVDRTIAGEYEPALVAWVDEVARGAAVAGAPRGDAVVSLGRGKFGLPARHLLPPLDRYARLAVAGELRLAGYVEASHGCAHRCRHCPVPVVYDGRTRLVGEDAVVADVGQLVGLGARHITFGDPDFLNGPHHAVRVVGAVHGAFPELTFDITTKVEHVLRHRDVWPALAGAGLLFVVSAFESASDHVLDQAGQGSHGGRRDRGGGRPARVGDRAPPVADAVHPLDHGRRTSATCSTWSPPATSSAMSIPSISPSACSSRPGPFC